MLLSVRQERGGEGKAAGEAGAGEESSAGGGEAPGGQGDRELPD